MFRSFELLYINLHYLLDMDKMQSAENVRISKFFQEDGNNICANVTWKQPSSMYG